MNVYRVKIYARREDDINHEAYFHIMPSREDILGSIKSSREVAPYTFAGFYDTCAALAQTFDWPDSIGKPCETGKSYKGGYIRIAMIPVLDNRGPSVPTKDVHTEHCCFLCGCEYGGDHCPVAAGLKKQSTSCDGDCLSR